MKKNGQWVGVNEEFIPEEEKYVENKANNEVKEAVDKGILSAKNYVTDKANQEKIKKTGKKVLKIGKNIVIGYGAFIGIIVLLVIVLFVVCLVTFMKTWNKSQDMFDNNDQIINNTSNLIDDYNDGYAISIFNNKFEIYKGTQTGLSVKSLLDNVVSNNSSTQDNLINVFYTDSMTTDTNSIANIKSLLIDTTTYEVTMSYDSSGYINLINIK